MAHDGTHWLEFESKLIDLYKSLIGDDDFNGCANMLYQSQQHYMFSRYRLNKRYRAILCVGDAAPAIKKDLEEIAELFYAAEAVEQKNYDPNNKPKLPVYVPRFLDENNEIFKIQIHENKAHSSKNYSQKEMVPVASCTKTDFAHKPSQKIINDAVKSLQELGYTVEVDNDPESPYVMIYVDVQTLCEKNECDSIQRRSPTGRQIRANFFSEKDGVVQKSKLATVGVVLLTKPVEVIHSLDRSIRTDAKYTKQHVDEIVLSDMPEVFRSGRLYKTYDKKK